MAEAPSGAELVRQAFDAYNRGDLEATLAVMSPDLELHAAPGLINAGDYHGHEGFVAWVTQWNEAWESFRVDPLSIEQIDAEHSLVEVKQTGQGAGSGIEVELTVFWAFEVRDGVTTRAHLYPEREQALAAVERWRS